MLPPDRTVSGNNRGDPFVADIFDYADRLQSSSAERFTRGEVRMLVTHGSQEAFTIAGGMCLELAAQPTTSPETSAKLIDESFDIWGQAIERWWLSETIKPATMRTALGYAALESYRSIILEDTLPDQLTVEKMHADLCNVGLMGIQLQEHFTKSEQTEEAKDTVGVLAEVALLLLHQRFTMQQLQDGSMLALPAHLTQDRGRGNVPAGAASQKWDLTVFSEFPPSRPEVTYKIQAKSRKHRDEPIYTPDIARVYVSEDLALDPAERKRGIKPYQVVKERVQEYTDIAAGVTKKRAGARSELLLDCLDKVTNPA